MRIVQLMVLLSWKKVEQLFNNCKTFKHNAVLKLEHGSLEPVLEWCNLHCHGEWGWMDHQDLYTDYAGGWIFLFDSDQDFSHFILRWK
jgi:hypothetical protein